MQKEKLPGRRHGVRMPVAFIAPDGNTLSYYITYNISGASERVIECFICHEDGARFLKSGSMLRAIMEDSCIAISLLLQTGMTMAQIAKAFGENRPEGQTNGPPSSPLGAIARMGAEIDERAREEQ